VRFHTYETCGHESKCIEIVWKIVSWGGFEIRIAPVGVA
jgi:hypothetical protein